MNHNQTCRLVGGGVLALIVASLLVPSVPGAPAPEPELKIAVNATTIESFPVFLAAESLSRTDKDHQVRIVPVPNGRVAMAQLVSGAADAATGSETQALLNTVTDPRIRIVVTLSECRYRIVAR